MACAAVISAHLAVAPLPLCTRAIFDYGIVYWGRGDDDAAVIGTEIPSRSVYKLPPFASPHLARNGWLEWSVRVREETRAIVTLAGIKSEMKNVEPCREFAEADESAMNR